MIQTERYALCQLPCLKCFISYDETCVLDKFSLDEIVSKWIFVQYVFSPLLACLLTSASQCQKIRTRAHTSNTFSASKLLFSCIKIKSALFYNLKAIETGIILSIMDKTYIFYMYFEKKNPAKILLHQVEVHLDVPN